MYKFRSNNILLLGDTHSRNKTAVILASVPEGWDVVHLGDGGFHNATKTLAFLTELNELCEERNIKLFHLRGNHDDTDPEIWESEWSNIFLVKEHSYAEFPNKKKALLLSGALSIDRSSNLHNGLYWVDEGTKPIEIVEKSDVVFSHDAPEQFNHSSNTIPRYWSFYADRDHYLVSDAIHQRKIVGDIIQRSGATSIFHGHFHNNITAIVNGVYARCISINELFEYDADKDYQKGYYPKY